VALINTFTIIVARLWIAPFYTRPAGYYRQILYQLHRERKDQVHEELGIAIIAEEWVEVEQDI
jgi:hypothetical protein